MREVSVQASNDTNNDQDRANLQAEMDAMIVEVDRIASTTTWAGENLMRDSSGTSFSFQVGSATGSENQITINIDGMGSKNLGLAASSEAERATNTLAQTAYDALVTTENTAIADVATKAPIKIAADATLAAAVTLDAAVAATKAGTDAATTAEEKSVALRNSINAGSGDGATGMDTLSAALKLEVYALDDQTEKDDAIVLFDAFDAAVTAFKDDTSTTDVITKYDAVVTAYNAAVGATTTVSSTAITDGTIDATVADAFTAVKALVDAFDTTTAAQTAADTAASNLVVAEDAASVATAARKAATDPADLQGQDLSVTSGSNARDSIVTIDAAIKTVNIQRSELGAVSNRLNHTVNNLTNISSNLSAARGGIEDADFALETTNLAKNQILQQASTAMLAQANASQRNVLALLQI
jgi:flagellin